MSCWDEYGNLHCGNELLYGCDIMTERGTQATTDIIARRRGWRIWQGSANCPQCSKPVRNVRSNSVLEQDPLELDFGAAVAKKSRKNSKRQIS